jgi:hypothetical protein
VQDVAGEWDVHGESFVLVLALLERVSIAAFFRQRPAFAGECPDASIAHMARAGYWKFERVHVEAFPPVVCDHPGVIVFLQAPAVVVSTEEAAGTFRMPATHQPWILFNP